MADVQFNLRIPEELKDKVRDAAKESGRSINAEAQYRLEQSFNNISNDEALMWKEEAEALTSEIRDLLHEYRKR